MKRWAFTIILFLLLGAIVNVAVAWAMMIMTSNSSFEPHYDVEPGEQLRWPAGIPMDWPSPGIGERGRAIGFTYESYSCTLTGEESTEVWDGLRLEVGWPTRGLLSLWHSHSLSNDEAPQSQSRLLGIAVPDNDLPWNWPPRILPLVPLWPGFAINTVFYALVLWLLFAAPFALRRRRRLKRDLCPKCAYDLRGSVGEACPECGETG